MVIHITLLIFYISLVEGQADAVAELIALGCSPQEMDINGATPLHMASQAATLETGLNIIIINEINDSFSDVVFYYHAITFFLFYSIDEATHYREGALECIKVCQSQQ